MNSFGTSKWCCKFASQIAAAIFVLFCTSCKPKIANESETKSLDNLTRSEKTSVTKNTCGLATVDIARLKKSRTYIPRIKLIFASDSIKDEILATMAAVPEPVQAAFFGMGGSIQASNDIAGKCSFKNNREKEFGSEKSSVTVSCWRKKDGDTPPVIYVVSKPEAIRHGLLRSFSYIYTQLFLNAAENVEQSLAPGEKKSQLTAALKRFKDQKKALAEALLLDTRDLAPSVHARLTQQRQESEKDFEDFVTAETIDSFYCSKRSNPTLQRNFKTTFKAFTAGSLGVPGMGFDLGNPWY